MSALDRLAELAGLLRSYHDIYGREQLTSDATERALLAAMGLPVDDPNAVDAAIVRLSERRWTQLVAPVSVQRQGEGLNVLVCVRHGDLVRWSLRREDGTQEAGEMAADHLPRLEENAGRLLVRLDLPGCDIGYHTVTIDTGERQDSHRLIVVPSACFVPEHLISGGRGWGTAVQIYALRTDRSWGIGDYSALAELARVGGAVGASFVGVSPLHASFPHRPAEASPYSPSSRLFLNWIYIDVEAVPDYAASEAARALAASPTFQDSLAVVRASPLVDYAAVAALKRRALELSFEHFRARHLAADDARARGFRSFVEVGGHRLREHVLYEALQEYLAAKDPGAWGWPVWPDEYRDPASQIVSAFADSHRQRLEFFAYLQWVADEQLGRAAQAAATAGMRVGLYIDLAVGVDRGGSETWANQAVYATSASAGAPPDELALKGQNWGLPPLIPDALERAAYDPFIATLQRCMRHAGALRMDHVLALLRLFWVPSGLDATHGAYVRYPLRDLLGILALESVRNRCLVIGEDLGTVPPEVRTALAEHQVLSYRVFYFEQEHDMRPKAPEAYPRCALVTASTHDLPTLRGFWERRDLALRAELDLYPSAHIRERQEHGRGVQKQRILGGLAEAGVLGYDEARLEVPLSQELVRAVHAYLARTPSWLLAVQLEDVMNVLDQANLPGTVHEHANWRRRLPLTVDELAAAPDFLALVETLRQQGR